MKIQTAAAILALAAPAVGGAAVLQDSASAQSTTQTAHWVLYQTASHNLRMGDFVGTDRVTDAASGRTVGYDSITGHFDPKAKRATIQAAFSLRGGIIVVRVHLINGGPKFRGHIVTSTGAFAGATGTVRGHEGKGKRTWVTLTWTQ
jgi:hypothetical protein